MGVLLFDGVDDKLKWTTLASALSNVTVGTATAAFLIKPVGLNTGSTFDAFGYLLSGTGAGTAQFGLSASNGDNPVGDYGAPTSTTVPVVDGETYILVIRKPTAADLDVNYSRYTRSTDTWAHQALTGIGKAEVAATMLELCAWQGDDPYDGYMGVAAFWEGSMSQAQVEELSVNWATSDWWNNSLGNPAFLVELNVAAASVTDLAGNASSLTATGTTLDAGETLDTWNFDGTGSGGPQTIPLNQVTETDSSLAMVASKPIFKAMGLVSETDLAQTVTLLGGGQTVAIGLVNETDASLGMSALKPITVPLGIVSEADASLAMTALKPIIAALGQALETDSAFSFLLDEGGQVIPLGIVSETDLAQAMVALKPIIGALGLAEETDLALSIIVPSDGSEGGSRRRVLHLRFGIW